MIPPLQPERRFPLLPPPCGFFCRETAGFSRAFSFHKTGNPSLPVLLFLFSSGLRVSLLLRSRVFFFRWLDFLVTKLCRCSFFQLCLFPHWRGGPFPLLIGYCFFFPPGLDLCPNHFLAFVAEGTSIRSWASFPK